MHLTTAFFLTRPHSSDACLDPGPDGWSFSTILDLEDGRSHARDGGASRQALGPVVALLPPQTSFLQGTADFYLV